jgi:hypothetical protein
LAAGIGRVKGAKRLGTRTCNWLVENNVDFSLMEVGKATRADNKPFSSNHRATDFRSAGSRLSKLGGVVPRDTEAVGLAFTLST